MKTILITGSEGFTGRYVVRKFREEGFNVLGLVRHAPGEGEFGCDLTDKRQVQEVVDTVQPAGVIHLAGIAFVGHGDPAAFYSVNVMGTLNLLEALYSLKTLPEKVIIASSANVYGNPAVDVVDENTPVQPVNHYAASKLAMEYLVKTWFSRMPILLTRPFNYTGPGQSEQFLVPKIVHHFRAGKKSITLGNLNVARDFSDVRDVSRAYLQLFCCSAHSEIVNICSGTVYYLRQIVELMSELAGYTPKIRQDPKLVRDNEIRVLKGSNDKLVRLTGYRPRYPLPVTLRDMFLEHAGEPQR